MYFVNVNKQNKCIYRNIINLYFFFLIWLVESYQVTWWYFFDIDLARAKNWYCTVTCFIWIWDCFIPRPRRHPKGKAEILSKHMQITTLKWEFQQRRLNSQATICSFVDLAIVDWNWTTLGMGIQSHQQNKEYVSCLSIKSYQSHWKFTSGWNRNLKVSSSILLPKQNY